MTVERVELRLRRRKSSSLAPILKWSRVLSCKSPRFIRGIQLKPYAKGQGRRLSPPSCPVGSSKHFVVQYLLIRRGTLQLWRRRMSHSPYRLSILNQVPLNPSPSFVNRKLQVGGQDLQQHSNRASADSLGISTQVEIPLRGRFLWKWLVTPRTIFRTMCGDRCRLPSQVD